MINGPPNSTWFTWTAIALILAVIYSFVWPKHRIGATVGFYFLVLRWSHALAWLLLALNFLLRGLSTSFNEAANFFALAGGFMYLLFFSMTFLIKK